PGGQLMITSDVENFPGFPEGVTGPELMQKFKQQAEKFGATVRSENIAQVDFSKRPFTLVTEGGESVRANAVLIATGANAKLLGIKGEKELMATGAGVSACATCDGALYKGEELVVVGGGDTAMEEALFLTRFASKVTLVHRREEFRASKVMLERAQNHPKIAWELNAAVDEIITEKKMMGIFEKDMLTAVKLKSTVGKPDKVLKVGGLFVAIGHAPNVELFGEFLQLDDKGYLAVQPGTTRALGKNGKWVEGVFACGDVQDSYYRQAITAAGTGCMSAIDAERWLAEHHGH
ncbi:MAG TPA: FAD-dependent oxidoreductase, partial [Myxococcota bacterium]